VLDLTTQIDLLTSSLSGSEIASTPISGMLSVTTTSLAASLTSAIAHCLSTPYAEGMLHANVSQVDDYPD
jgi:hypothetical protein